MTDSTVCKANVAHCSVILPKSDLYVIVRICTDPIDFVTNTIAQIRLRPLEAKKHGYRWYTYLTSKWAAGPFYRAG